MAGPEYYLEDGVDRRDLEPAAGFNPTSWWTCSPETKSGDTALLYRSGVCKDIAHFVVVRSDAEVLDLPGDRFHRKHICQYQVVERFHDPLPWRRISSDALLSHWGAVKVRFVRSYFSVPDAYWQRLFELAGPNSQMLARMAADGIREIRLEQEIQRRLIARPDLLANAGLRDLVFKANEYKFSNGRRADLVYTRGRGPLRQMVVIELKRGEIGRRAVEQVLDYRHLLAAEPDHPVRPALAVLIGSRLHSNAQKLVGRGPGKPRFIPLSALGIETITSTKA